MSPSVPVATRTQPSAVLYRTAFCSRFCASRSSSTGSPGVHAGPADTRNSMPARRASGSRPSETRYAMSASSTGTGAVTGLSDRTRVSNSSMSRSCCPVTSSRAVRNWSRCHGAAGRSSGAPTRARCAASGVFIASTASAKNWRCARRTRSSRSTIASIVSASSETSSRPRGGARVLVAAGLTVRRLAGGRSLVAARPVSPAVPRPTGGCRWLASIRRAVAVIDLIWRTVRPASSHPSHPPPAATRQSVATIQARGSR